MAKDIVVPVWEKYSLSIEEAAVYFRIGENNIRNIINQNSDADFWFWNGFTEGCLKNYRRSGRGMV